MKMPKTQKESIVKPATKIAGESGIRLSARELAALQDMASGSEAISRRARAILDWDSGIIPAEIAKGVRLNKDTVQRYIREFKIRRMASLTGPVSSSSRRAARSRSDAGKTEKQVNRISVEELCQKFDVDMNHATHVAALARQLLALTAPLHGLDEHYLDVIHAAGLLHNVAYSMDPRKHHTRGRNIVLNTYFSNLDDADRDIIAVVTAFHRKAWTPERLEKETSYGSLPASSQPVALWLSAALRIADGLDYSQSQSTSLTETTIGKERCVLGVKGPHAEMDGTRADLKADMWRAVTGISLRVEPRQAVEQRLRRRVTRLPDPPALLPTEPMADAGRKIIYFHLQRMFFHEVGARAGTNPESAHDMRVAVRRMLSALNVFGAGYKGKIRKSFRRELKTIEGKLGGVRDLDVNIAQARAYLETFPADARPDLAELIADWEAERGSNRSRLLGYLDSQRYAEFAHRLLEFCQTPPASGAEQRVGTSMPVVVAHAAPAIVWTRYEAVCGYEPILQDAPIETFHALRAEAKRARYTLEFFRDVLDAEARDLIALLIRVQDHLGALQDADITSTLIHKYIKRQVKQERKPAGTVATGELSARLGGITAYLQSRQTQIEVARESFGPLWAEVISPEGWQALARTIGVL